MKYLKNLDIFMNIIYIILSPLKYILSFRTQTLSYFGYTTKFLKSFIEKNKINTIDRITKIGDTMKMNFIWDGYNIYNDLTKDIEII